MDVSFDGLRKRLIADYNSLTRKLNVGVQDKSWSPHIVIHTYEIQKELDGIRNSIITLAFMYQEGKFKELPEDTHFENFNPIEDEK